MVTATAREENGEFCAPTTRTASWLKALAVKLSRPSGRSRSYTCLIGFNPRRLQWTERGMSSHATDLSVYAKSSSSSSCMLTWRFTPTPGYIVRGILGASGQELRWFIPKLHRLFSALRELSVFLYSGWHKSPSLFEKLLIVIELNSRSIFMSRRVSRISCCKTAF